MLPPHELKNKSFSKTIRGYNPIEVDEYVDFLIEKYTELYRENDELERKLKTAVTRLDEIKGDEDSIRSALVDAKRAASKIKSDAEERAEAIVRAAKASCNTILSDFNEKILVGKDTISELRRDALALKQELFEKYSEHIRFIEALTENIDEDSLPDVSEFNQLAFDSLKAEVFAKYNTADSTPEICEESEKAENENSAFDFTREFDINETEQPTEGLDNVALSVERVPLVTSEKRGIKEQAMELGRVYKEEQEIINTPDSDPDDDMAYLDFIKSVSGKENAERTSKDDDFDMLFDETKSKKKK